jgi:hypothetical protein
MSYDSLDMLVILKELLENKGGLKIGVVVNDVAAINIDAKLVRERSSSGVRTKSGEGVEFVELENGCACCNASDELLACILQVSMSYANATISVFCLHCVLAVCLPALMFPPLCLSAWLNPHASCSCMTWRKSKGIHSTAS